MNVDQNFMSWSSLALQTFTIIPVHKKTGTYVRTYITVWEVLEVLNLVHWTCPHTNIKADKKVCIPKSRIRTYVHTYIRTSVCVMHPIILPAMHVECEWNTYVRTYEYNYCMYLHCMHVIMSIHTYVRRDVRTWVKRSMASNMALQTYWPSAVEDLASEEQHLWGKEKKRENSESTTGDLRMESRTLRAMVHDSHHCTNADTP